ncbi:cystatin-like protein, partial [Clarias magur]
MDGALKLLLLEALTLLVSAQIFNYYNNLPDSFKTPIDKELKKANIIFGAGYHVAFHSLRNTPKPWIDCLVCTTKDNEELVDCGTLRDVNN